MQWFQKRREKVGENSFEALVIEDFDWGNEWVDPSLSQPQGARGCPDDNQDITWEDVDVAIGASSNLRGRNLHRTATTVRRGQTMQHYACKRPTTTRPTVPEEDEAEEGLEQEQHSSMPNAEGEDSDYVEDDDDVSNDDQEPTHVDQDGEDNTNANEFDDDDF
ncbi:hypothetical protein CFC21_104548 [Triticum aestivum]|uniref:Uncharacterized protein n=2 Tax=Triticum aestivum TaxID=4565 RepID=A0A3B6SLI3_WHEAT|nr:hypothetical protein CFC21_104548 [Triticum aestivum]